MTKHVCAFVHAHKCTCTQQAQGKKRGSAGAPAPAKKRRKKTAGMATHSIRALQQNEINSPACYLCVVCMVRDYEKL